MTFEIHNVMGHFTFWISLLVSSKTKTKA